MQGVNYNYFLKKIIIIIENLYNELNSRKIDSISEKNLELLLKKFCDNSQLEINYNVLFNDLYNFSEKISSNIVHSVNLEDKEYWQDLFFKIYNLFYSAENEGAVFEYLNIEYDLQDILSKIKQYCDLCMVNLPD